MGKYKPSSVSFAEKIEFKSYGLYSEAAKLAQLEGHNVTVDQVDKIYTWYIKNVIEELCSNDSLQAHLKGLGKIKFNAKRAISGLNHQVEKLKTLVNYYIQLEDKLNKGEDVSIKLKRVYLVIKGRHNKIIQAVESYGPRLEKIYQKDSIREDQYFFHKERYIKVKETLNQLYEPIQRILRANQEGA